MALCLFIQSEEQPLVLLGLTVFHLSYARCILSTSEPCFMLRLC